MQVLKIIFTVTCEFKELYPIFKGISFTLYIVYYVNPFVKLLQYFSTQKQ